jgi:hypothetical protein
MNIAIPPIIPASKILMPEKMKDPREAVKQNYSGLSPLVRLLLFPLAARASDDG